MENGNSRTVYVVYADDRKDLKDAERFGKLRDVFSSVGRVYNTVRMIEHARRVLSDWDDGDHLLMIGDPVLCAVCMSVVLEKNSVVNVLRWDRNDFQYSSQRWDFMPPEVS